MKYWQEIDFWNTKLHWNVEDIKLTTLHEGNSGSYVYRAELKGKNIPKSVIIKQTFIPKKRSILSLDTNSWKREVLFYKQASQLKVLDTAKLYHFEIDEVNKQSLLIIEDLVHKYYLPKPNHIFNKAEQGVIFQTYLQLESLSKQLKHLKLNTSYLAKPEFTHVTPVDIVEAVHKLDNWEPTKMLVAYIKPNIDSIINKLNTIYQEYKKLSPVLSYNDFYPGNIAISLNIDKAILFDFQAIGWGNSLNNMLNAFGNKAFADSKKDLQLRYLEAVKFKNTSSFNLTQLLTINELLSSLYMVWVMASYASLFPTNTQLPKWFDYVIRDLPNQCKQVTRFI
ncbi:hypothetical protein IMX26_10765 [Clostridium sp. 'deep sea']|uniref:hypothetical protein n=1 Tax=Clostridium sp. 'deep sea' TaxID=2779445 RepID=UPI0018968EC2|nr:hypothetical protein [Clostridium sp. 'deep sea']QOR33974.1 hypothetical protein IMX26_10765 [Clostridium sp. 'deep sea']